MDLRTDLDCLEGTKVSLPGIEPGLFSWPARSQFLYRLSFLGAHYYKTICEITISVFLVLEFSEITRQCLHIVENKHETAVPWCVTHGEWTALHSWTVHVNEHNNISFVNYLLILWLRYFKSYIYIYIYIYIYCKMSFDILVSPLI
jgi:hypothetical protein